MASNVFVPNPAFALQYQRDPQCAAMLALVAEAVKARAQEIARAEAYDTGAYEESLDAHVDIEGVGYRVRLEGTVRYAAYLEVGTEDTPAHHTLSRAAESVGLIVGGGQ